MQTNFTPDQLKNPAIAEANDILRKCVHCGFCTATCPTYKLLGDELDSPRGRIYMIKDMLENDRPADKNTVKHIDRCLSCLSCMTTCPSGVNYMHLVDHAREHIEKTYKRPLMDRALRNLLAVLLPNPALFRFSLTSAKIARPFINPFTKILPRRLRTMLEMAPAKLPKASPLDQPQIIKAEGKTKMRVALMTGCAQKVLDPAINEATISLLTRHGVEIIIAKDAGCCGALTHHMGKVEKSHASALANINAWMAEKDAGLDAIVINTSGCGTTVKDYGFMFRNDTDNAENAAYISSITKDVSEVVALLDLKPDTILYPKKVTYHSACSLQHGQKITDLPKQLLQKVGFEVASPAEGHLCCGSAGTYNLLQGELATQLRDRKLKHIAATNPQIIAAGNIGCITQIASGTDTPILHTVQLLDWATGGPKPKILNS